MAEPKPIPDDVKLFLRAVLVSSPGLQQSKVPREYRDLTGDQIPFGSLGFKCLFDFLKALERDVTRLEFSPKHEENIVFAVLDDSKFSSKHAQKYANKSVTGIPGKNPEEVKQWKAERGSQKSALLPTPTPRRNQTTSNRGRSRQSYNNRQNNNFLTRNISQPILIDNKQNLGNQNETIPTVEDWRILNLLEADISGRWNLYTRTHGVEPSLKMTKEALLKHFAAYDPYHDIQFVNNSRGSRIAFIRFLEYMKAYRAWKELDMKILNGQRLTLRPSENNVGVISKNRNSLFELAVEGLHPELLMSTFVFTFGKYPGLSNIFYNPTVRSAIIRYSIRTSAELAFQEIKTLKIGNGEHTVHIKWFEHPANGNCRSNVYLQQRITQQPQMIPGTLQHTSWIPRASQQQSRAIQQQTPTKSIPSKQNLASEKEEIDFSVFDNIACKFCMNYRERHAMFQATCPRKAKIIAQDFPDEITFTITYPVDSCRFWMFVLDDKMSSYKKLEELELSLAEMAKKVQPQNVLPKVGHRGSALYADDDTDGKWYRCYVMESFADEDKIRVFFCDYGNIETVSRVSFRATYPDMWQLPPQAVPCRLSGLENRYPSKSSKNFKGSAYLVNILGNDPWRAKVVKNGASSQPHVIEINCLVRFDPKAAASPRKLTVEELLGGGYVRLLGEKEEQDNEKEEVLPVVDTSLSPRQSTDDESLSEIKESALMELQRDEDEVEEEIKRNSLFDFDGDDLKLGLISEVHDVELFYLQFGLSGVTAIEELLLNFDPLGAANLVKDNVVLYLKDGVRRRVVILNVHPQGHKAKVLHVDYGTIEWVATRLLQQMHPTLEHCKFQARPASLAGVGASTDLGVKALKQLIKRPLDINVILEHDDGKVLVEVFEMERERSVNKRLLDEGVLKPATEVPTQLHKSSLSASMVSLTVSESGSHSDVGELSPSRNMENRTRTSSTSSWKSESGMMNTPPKSDRPTDNIPDEKPANLKLDITGQFKLPFTPEVHRTHASGSHKISTAPSFPPPDIVSSNRRLGLDEEVTLMSGMTLSGKVLNIITASGVQACEGIVENRDGKLTVRRDAIEQEKRDQEQTRCGLQRILEQLEEMMTMDDQELMSHLKKSKKEKLDRMLRIHDLEKTAQSLQDEHNSLKAQTEQIIAQI